MGRHKSIDSKRMEAGYSFVHTLFSAQGRPFSHLGKAPIQSLYLPNCHLLRKGLFSLLGVCPSLWLMALLSIPCAATQNLLCQSLKDV